MRLKRMSTISNLFMASFPTLFEEHFSLTDPVSGVTKIDICILLTATVLFAALPSTAARRAARPIGSPSAVALLRQSATKRSQKRAGSYTVDLDRCPILNQFSTYPGTHFHQQGKTLRIHVCFLWTTACYVCSKAVIPTRSTPTLCAPQKYSLQMGWYNNNLCEICFKQT